MLFHTLFRRAVYIEQNKKSERISSNEAVNILFKFESLSLNTCSE